MTGSPDPATDVVDLSKRLRPCGNQGRRGTCVAFAVSALHELEFFGEFVGDPEDFHLSEEVLFWGAKQIDGDASYGTRFTSANVALQRWGQPLNERWPYDELRDHRTPSYRPPPEAVATANCWFTTLRPITPGVQEIRAELNAARPVVVGIPVWDGLREARNEPLPPPTAAEVYPTRHAVAVVGYDAARGAMLIRNSWGPGWGTDGHLWLADGVASQIVGAWVVEQGATAAEAAVDPDDEELTSDDST